MRVITLSGCAALALAWAMPAAYASAQPTAPAPVEFQIPAQSLSSALAEYARQSGQQLLYRPSLVAGKSANAVTGALDPSVALTQLLDGSGLVFSRSPSGAILIRDQAQGANPTSPTQLGAAESAAPSEPQTEEIIVTAQKRDERLIETPLSVSVLSAADLQRLGALRLRDFANTVPGLNLTTTGAGDTQISLRGVTAGTDISATVGIVVDDIPYGSSSSFALGGRNTLDMAPLDISRIEVLRGPQGTLYGAATMGGLLKYVTVAPDSHDFGGDVRVGVSDTSHGGTNYDVAGALNIPIVTDQFAVRVSGYDVHDGGFIDNISRGRSDVDHGDTQGGRFDALFQPNNALSIRVTALAQDISRDGQATADYATSGAHPFGALTQRRLADEPFSQDFRLYAGTVAYDFGGATLTSITSYQTVDAEYGIDVTASFAFLNGPPFNRGYSAVGSTTGIATDKFTQEVRLASNDSNATISWLIGGFYTRESSDNLQVANPFTVGGAPAPNDLLTLSITSLYKDYAAFGDLTWRLNDRFDVTGGIRYAQNEQTVTQTGSGLFAASRPTRSASDHVFTYLANARYHFSDNATAYFRYATGYRPGGPNIVLNNAITGQPLAQPTFDADSLQSYELGFKNQTEDGRFSADIAAYYVNWDDIQIAAQRGGPPPVGVRTNAPHATVRGVELTLAARPTDALRFTGAFAYVDAFLAEAAPDLGGAKGERLINVPRFTAALNADYDLPFWDTVSPSIGATYRFVGDRRQGFGASAYRLPEYDALDLRAGLNIGVVDLQLYAHNVFDEHGQFSERTLNGLAQVAVQQPRTIGISASTHF